MKIGILSYGAGNIFSVYHALKRCGVEPHISSRPEILSRCDKLIFPGVGNACFALNQLNKMSLAQFVCSYTRPLLGICLGMQLMAESTEEGNQQCLGIVGSMVRKFTPGKIVPHTGWNSVFQLKGKLFSGIPEDANFYFVHSYAMQVCDDATSLCRYKDEVFTASLEKDNFFGVQFHPEKSGKWGEVLLRNFLFKT